MIQFYFLSVSLNLACGLALVLSAEPAARPFLRQLSALMADSRLRLALGILGMVTGLLKLVLPLEGEVPLVGDLVPALIGFMAGGVLVLEIHRGPETPFLESLDPEVDATVPVHGDTKRALRRRRLEALLLRSGRVIGAAAICAGLIHLLFPLELFL